MKTTIEHMLVYFALCLTIVAAVGVDQAFLRKPKGIKQTIDNTPDDELTDAALKIKKQRAEAREYYKWHQKGSKRIIPMEEQFGDCMKSFWASMTNATERNRCLLALGHVLTDEQKDQESTEEVAERQVLFEEATTAYNTLVKNFTAEEEIMQKMKDNVTMLKDEGIRASADLQKNQIKDHEDRMALKDGYDPSGDPTVENYQRYMKEEHELDQINETMAAHLDHVTDEYQEAEQTLNDEIPREAKIAKQLRHATVKYKNYKAQHAAEIADSKKHATTHSKSSAHRQFHVISVAAIAMIALAL